MFSSERSNIYLREQGIDLTEHVLENHDHLDCIESDHVLDLVVEAARPTLSIN